MFKHHINIFPSPLYNLFTPNNTQHNHHTRQNNDLYVTLIKSKMCINYLVFIAYILYNHIKKIIDVSYACDKTNLKNAYSKIA